MSTVRFLACATAAVVGACSSAPPADDARPDDADVSEDCTDVAVGTDSPAPETDAPAPVPLGARVEVTYGDPSVFFENPLARAGEVVRLEAFTLTNVGDEPWPVPALPLPLFHREGDERGPFAETFRPQAVASSVALFDPRQGGEVARIDLDGRAPEEDIDLVFDLGGRVLAPGESLTLHPVLDLIDGQVPETPQSMAYEVPWALEPPPADTPLAVRNRNGLPSGAEGYVSLPWIDPRCPLAPVGGAAIGPPFSQGSVHDNLALSGQIMIAHGNTTTGDVKPGGRICYALRDPTCGPVDLTGLWLLIASGDLRPLPLSSSRIDVRVESSRAGLLLNTSRLQPANPLKLPVRHRLERDEEICIAVDVTADVFPQVDDPAMPDHPLRGKYSGSGSLVPLGADVLTTVDTDVGPLAFRLIHVNTMWDFCDPGTGACFDATRAFAEGGALAFGTTRLSYD